MLANKKSDFKYLAVNSQADFKIHLEFKKCILE